MSILQVNNKHFSGSCTDTAVVDPVKFDVQTSWHNIVVLYHGFDAYLSSPFCSTTQVACVDQSVASAYLKAVRDWPAQILSLKEQNIWKGHGLDPIRKLHWLMGRLAAKKAIWRVISDACVDTLSLQASDIEILNAEDGSPYYSNNTLGTASLPLQISIAHTDGLAIAVASHASGLGIDVERVDRYGPSCRGGEEFPQMTFSEDERAQIECCVGLLDATTLTRIWTAKEAAGKAAQLGLGQILKHCRFTSCSPDLSIVTLGLNNAKRESSQVDVRTVQEQDFFIALAVL